MRLSTAVALLSMLFLSSCSTPDWFELRNNSSVAIRIQLATDNYIEIGQGMTRGFSYEAGPDNLQADMVIVTRGCRHYFPMWETIRRLEWWRYHHRFPLQLERDLSLYVLPAGAQLPASVSVLQEVQGDGFAVRPRSQDCGVRQE